MCLFSLATSARHAARHGASSTHAGIGSLVMTSGAYAVILYAGMPHFLNAANFCGEGWDVATTSKKHEGGNE